MKIADIPSRFPIPFGNSAGASYIRSVPEASQIGIQNGAASLTDGFPPLNFQPVGSGGVPPFGQDMNGILNLITKWSQWQGAGSPVTYNSTFSTSIGGYPKGALLAATGFAGFWVNLVDDNTSNPDSGGANWSAFYPYPLETLSANRTYYVSTTGSDSNNGLTSGSPWRTLQHAWDYVQSRINLAGYAITIQVANGTYTSGISASGILTGSSSPDSFTIQGNAGSPASVFINTTGGAIAASNGGQITVSGVKIASATATVGAMSASRGGTIQFNNVNFGACSGYHINASSGGQILINGSYSITGGAINHYHAISQGAISALSGNSIVATLSGTPAFTIFATALTSALIYTQLADISFSGGATGSRYNSTLLSNIYTQGGGASFFPGDSAGTTGTSGIYN